MSELIVALHQFEDDYNQSVDNNPEVTGGILSRDLGWEMFKNGMMDFGLSHMCLSYRCT
jgi:hypothetical protein